MITDEICKGLGDYFAAQSNGDLSGVTVFLRDGEDDLSYPALVIAEDGPPDIHPVIDTAFTGSLRIMLKTIPEDTTDASHRLMAKNVASLLRCQDAVMGELRKSLTVYQFLGGEGGTDADDRYRVTEFPAEFVAAS